MRVDQTVLQWAVSLTRHGEDCDQNISQGDVKEHQAGSPSTKTAPRQTHLYNTLVSPLTEISKNIAIKG